MTIQTQWMLALSLMMLWSSCNKEVPSNELPGCGGTVTDIDGHVYNTVQIGDQCWMAENLKVERYRNGDSILTGLIDSAWLFTKSGAFAEYGNKPTYGLLYNGYAVDDTRGLCPTGWHVPTDGEWTQLTDFLGGTVVAGQQMKTTGTLSAGTGLWQAPDSWLAENKVGTNSSGFSGLPGGYRSGLGNFYTLGIGGYWWSASEDSNRSAWSWRLYYSLGSADRIRFHKLHGFSVRCLKD